METSCSNPCRGVASKRRSPASLRNPPVRYVHRVRRFWCQPWKDMINLRSQALPESSMKRFIAPLLVMCGFLAVAMAEKFPLWEQLLDHYGGTTDETPVASMKMGNHMQMSLKGTPQPGDAQRAQEIVAAARKVLVRYADVNVALRQGYRPFYPTGRMG